MEVSSKNLRWILVRRCSRFFGWRMPDGPRIGDLDGTEVGICKWKGTRGIRWGFPRIFSVGPGIGEVEGCLVGNYRCTPARLCAPSFS